MFFLKSERTWKNPTFPVKEINTVFYKEGERGSIIFFFISAKTTNERKKKEFFF